MATEEAVKTDEPVAPTAEKPTQENKEESPEQRKEDTIQAINMLAQGKRNLVCGEIPTAVNQLQDACKLLAKVYGETAKECAEAYFCYGQSLLELARMENGVLGNALQGVPEDEEATATDKDKKDEDQFESADNLPGEEREKIRDDVVEAMGERDEEKKLREMKESKVEGEKVEKSEGKEKDSGDAEEAMETVASIEKGEGKVNVKDTSENVKGQNGDAVMKEKSEKTTNGDIKENEDKTDVKSDEKTEEKVHEEKMETAVSEPSEAEKTKDSDDKEKAEVSGDKEKADIAGDKEKADVAGDKEKAEVAGNKEKAEVAGDKEKAEVTGDKEKAEVAGDKEKAEVAGDKEKAEVAGDKEKAEVAGDKEKAEDAEEKDENMEDDDEGKDDEEEEDESQEDEESAEEGTSEKKDGEENPDDVSNLQLSWEMLELSKMIFLKQEDKAMKLKAARAFLMLGEVSLETEQYEQAIDDIKACLKIQTEQLEPEDRLLAETQYQLGLALSFNKQFDPAIECYKEAIRIIEAKIVKLEKIVEENSSNTGKVVCSIDDPVANSQKEIKDLKEILPDIAAKIDDAEEDKKNMESLKSLAKEACSGQFGESSSSVTTEATTIAIKPKPSDTEEKPKPDEKINDISHLVRKKRKPEEEAEAEEADAKKSRSECGAGDADDAATNGDTVPKTNGAPEENGVKHSPAKEDKSLEIKEKTVESVKKGSDTEVAMETTEAATV